MTDYMPTTDRVRDGYAHDGLEYERQKPEVYEQMVADGYAEFDRWIAEHDRQVKAEAWAESRKAWGRWHAGVTDTPPINPYLNGDSK